MQGDLKYTVVKSVLIVAGVFLALETGVAAAVHYLGLVLPNSFGVVVTVLSTMTGAGWFGRKLNRSMSKRERFGFAVGVTLVNALVPVGFLVVLMMFAGLPVNADSFDLVLAGGRGDLFQPFVVWLVIFILSLVFLQAYLIGWFSTRQRTKKSAASE